MEDFAPLGWNSKNKVFERLGTEQVKSFGGLAENESFRTNFQDLAQRLSRTFMREAR